MLQIVTANTETGTLSVLREMPVFGAGVFVVGQAEVETSHRDQGIIGFRKGKYLWF